MGLDACSCIFLGAAKAAGVDFSRLAMIGRQSFWPGKASLGKVFDRYGIGEDPEMFMRCNKYSERYFELLGANEIVSFDVSDYESASVICDMNYPVPARWHKTFSCVYDGGTIEHVFNISQALKNCMEMVEVGGYFTQVNIANNFMGHGFWQFSPEMIFNVFSEVNGFQVMAVLMREVVPGAAWHVVSDPSRIRERITLCNSRPTYVFTIARRIKDVEIFRAYPQQCYYEGVWDEASGGQHSLPAIEAAREGRTWRRLVPQPIKDMAAWLLKLHNPWRKGYAPYCRGFRRSVYRPTTESELLRGSFIDPPSIHARAEE